MSTFDDQLQKAKTAQGFIAALDQSGGSTPKALGLYGISEDAWSNDEEMFGLVHQMRSRIATSPAFNGDRILGAILFENTVDREIENEINNEALKYYKDVLEAAAEECGYAIVEMGPLPRKLSSRPRFDQDYDDVTVYVFRYQAELDEGVAVGPIYQNRTSRVIVCTKVEDMQPSDVTRREFEMLRKNFALRQMSAVMGSAFTQEALAERYHLEKPVGELVEPQ